MAEPIKLSAKITGENPQSYAGTVVVGDNLKEATALFGEDNVYQTFRQQAVIKAQAFVRGLMKAGKSDKEIGEALKEWRPDTTRRVRKDPVEKIKEAIEKLEGTQKEEAIALLKAVLKS